MPFLNPITVLDKINLRNDITAVDIGSGSGGWVIPLARRLKRGTVYAIDMASSPLSILKEKAKKEGLSNIKTIQADVEQGTQLSDNSCDLVLMTNLLFEVENRKEVLKEGIRILRDGGHLLIVDWKEESPMNLEDPISSDEILKIMNELDLQLVKEVPTGIYHWGLFFRK